MVRPVGVFFHGVTMHNKYIFLAAFCVLLAGCNDDSSYQISPKKSCDCKDGQVCLNDKCVDADSPCLKCKDDEVCFKDVCYDSDSPCASCKNSQVCVNNACIGKNEPCAKCTDGQVCKNDKCVEADDPCAECEEGQVCKNKICYELGDPCSLCEEGQVCKKDTCYAADDPCLKCKDDQVCKDGECKKPADPCELCLPTDSCESGKCIACSTTICGTECCDEGDVCNVAGDACVYACDDGRGMCDNGDCCDEDMFCSVAGYCDRTCEFGSSCGRERTCCGEDEQCLDDKYCAPKCDSPRVLCGQEKQEVCCDEGMVCLQNECHTDCAENTTRCGADQNLCCDNNEQICIFNKCLKKGAPCEVNEDCELWEFCDVGGSKTCVSQDENTSQCVYRPKIEKFEPVVKWHYTDEKVEGTPAVADMTGDGIPEVVFEDEGYNLVALDGRTGAVLAKSKLRVWHPWGDLALADVDGDQVVEAMVSTGDVGTGKSGLSILVLENSGSGWSWKEKVFLRIDESLLSSNKDGNNRYYVDIHPAVADIDNDNVAEIVTAVGVIKGNDLSKWQCSLNLPSYTTWYRYGIAVADLDQDGQSELIADKIYNNKCQVLSDISESGWGFPAIADTIPNSGEAGELVPEIIRSGNGSVSAWKVYKTDAGWSQKKIWSKSHPGGGGGHPNIADFNGDKKAEIGIAGADYYAVFRGDTGEVIWQAKTQDHSSQRTGSSVFDFEGDGKAEVVYRDECYLRVYNGSDGTVIMEEPATSGTVIDYPLIVDVDADGKTEIITTSAPVSGCTFKDNRPAVGNGVIAYKDSHSKWVRTRKIWNQHAYHVTNINEDGTVPSPEKANWLNKRLNNYRANTQPDDAFNAPNLTPGDLKAVQACPNYKLTATVKNEGSASVRDVWVSFYIRGYDTGSGPDDLLLGSVLAKGVIPPGGSLDVTLDWNQTGKLMKSGADVKNVILPQQVSFTVDDGPGQSSVDFFNECHEDDNDSAAVKVEPCPEIIA